MWTLSRLCAERILRFKKRFAHVEHGAMTQGRKLSEMSIEEMEGLCRKQKKES